MYLLQGQTSSGRLLVLPTTSTASVPVGTYQSIIRFGRQRHTVKPWIDSLIRRGTVKVILEKDVNLFWGRIEVPGFSATLQGSGPDDIIARFRVLLRNLISEDDTTRQLDQLVYQPVYDLTATWQLFREIKTGYLGDLSGLDQDTLAQFMNGKAYPSAEQAQRLETALQELGRQLLQLSIR
ncbi:hypothetical protein GCM10027578_32050 [Spirosoma luteolum]